MMVSTVESLIVYLDNRWINKIHYETKLVNAAGGLALNMDSVVLSGYHEDGNE